VRYFEDLSPAKDLGYLADGLTEGLIDQLSPVAGLSVISRNGVAPYRGGDVPRDSIARALGVGSLIEGSVEPAGGRVRVTVRLVDGPSGSDLDRKTYELPAGSAATVRDSITQEVSRMLRGRLGEEIRTRERRASTTNVDAWVLLQRGERLRKDAVTSLAAADTAGAGRQLADADSLLARAASLDDKWARPWVDRGWTAYQQLDLASGFDSRHYTRWLNVGLSHAGRALTLATSDADALELRGMLRYYVWILNLAPTPAASDSLLAGAQADLQAAVAANPQQAWAWALLSHLHMRLSQTAEGKLAALRAYEADPYLAQANSVLWRLFQASLDLEDGVEAAKWCAEGGRRFPEDRNFVECQITVNALPGARPDVARMWQLLDQNVALYPPNQREFRRHRGEILVAMTLVRAGLKDSADGVARRARLDPTQDPSRELVYIEAMLRNIMNDREEALRLVGSYLAANPQDRATMAKDYTWWWAGIRDDPRFRSLVGAPR
jgi:serine/threonine-protein kinase